MRRGTRTRPARTRPAVAAALAVAAATVLLLDPAAPPTEVARAAGGSFSFDWTGGATAPVPWSPGAVDDWDLVKNYDAPSGAAGPQEAGHGADCSPPPAAHPISSLDDAVYICRNHLMTALAATDQAPANYGAVYLAPAQLMDFSQGTSTLKFDVSTLRTSSRDWWDIWVTPFGENLVLPLEADLPAYQGPPKDAVHIRMDNASGTSPNAFCSFFRGQVFRGYTPTDISRDFGSSPPCMENQAPPSAAVRSQFQLEVAQNHVRFSMPGTAAVWVDAQVDLPFSQGVVQLGHHSYNPTKDGAGSPDTWHWSGFQISQAAPFTMLRAGQDSVHGTSPQTVRLAQPAPEGGFLRFAAIGSIKVGFNGGGLQPAVVAAQGEGGGTLHPEHFTSYWMAVPTGTTSVTFDGSPNVFGQPFWIQDVSVWSLAPPPPGQAASTQAQPTAVPGGSAPPPAAPPSAAPTVVPSSTSAVMPAGGRRHSGAAFCAEPELTWWAALVDAVVEPPGWHALQHALLDRCRA